MIQTKLRSITQSHYPRKSFAVSEWLPSFFPFVIRLYDILIRLLGKWRIGPAVTEIIPNGALVVLSEAFLLRFVGPHDPAVQGFIELACPDQPLTNPVIETATWDSQRVN